MSKKTFWAPKSYFWGPGKKTFRGPKSFFLTSESPDILRDCWLQIGKPQTFHAISWFDGSKGRKEMSSVRVVVSSRTEPQWERECKLTQSFADVMSEFAAQSSEKWHFSRFSFWIGEQLVRPEELLGSKTNGQSGLLLVSAQTPSEHCLVKVSEKLRPVESSVDGPILWDAFQEFFGSS